MITPWSVASTPSRSQKQTRTRLGTDKHQADEEARLVGAQGEAQSRHPELAMLPQAGAQRIGNINGQEEPGVHDGVKDRERDGALGRAGVAPQGGDLGRGRHPFADRQQDQAAAQGHPCRVVKVRKTRERMHRANASRKVLRKPRASVSEPTSTMRKVSPADQIVTTTPAGRH